MNETLISNPDLVRAISKIGELMNEKDKPILVALDGRSGTGKSTIAKKIAERLGGVEIIADDFWAGGSNDEWDRKSPKEKAELAIDWKRIRTEVLEPLLAGKSASWQPFDWKAGHGLSQDLLHSEPKPLIVLDGAYSTRPELQDLIDFSILVEIPDDTDRRTRLRERESEEYMNDWHGRWDIAEDYYFSEVRPRESFDFVISNP
jgi:uridine kinase